MRQDENNRLLSFTKVLTLIGKPLFFLFTVIAVGLLAVFHFLFLFLRKIHLPSLHITVNFNLPAKIIALCALLLAFSLYYFIFRNLPSVYALKDGNHSLTTKIYDRHGTLLYQIYKDQNRSLIKLADLPPHLINATLSAEDKNFYSHHGVSLSGILRAAFSNLTRGTMQGGSTITQQLVKNVLLTREKSLSRKLKEIVLALEAELIYSKAEILEMYFNQVPYGGTAYGIEQASWQYFGKHAPELNLAESALLAGLPISPTTLSPYGTNPYLAITRQHQVLQAMVENNYLSEEGKLQAQNTPIILSPQGINIQAPHFVMYVKDLLVNLYGEDLVSRGGLTVKTTLDLSVQHTLQSEINLELAKLAQLHVTNAGGLVIDPQSGQILAMVGSRDFFDPSIDGQVNITLQPRQPGSSIKPLTYSLALMQGMSPASVIDDTPVCFRLAGQPDYCPGNYDNKFHGPVTLRTALGNSYNIPAIKLLNSLGITNLVNLAKSMGITTWDDPSRFGLSLTLGGGEVKMLDLAQVYTVFANQGSKVPLTPLISVENSLGQTFPLPSPAIEQVLPEAVAYQINSILADPSARASAFGFNSVLNIKNYQVAVKTGTTNNLRDNWTFGYTPNLLVATWVGNNDNTPMSTVASGITGASPIWSRTIQKLLTKLPKQNFTPPNTLILANTSCDSPTRYEYFIKGTEPKLDCRQTGAIPPAASATSP